MSSSTTAKQCDLEIFRFVPVPDHMTRAQFLELNPGLRFSSREDAFEFMKEIMPPWKFSVQECDIGE